MVPPPTSRPQASQQPPPVNINDSSRLQIVTAASSLPVKSHPLHHFPLSDLKWAINHTNTHRLRKPSEKLPFREADLGVEIQKGNLAVDKSSDGVSSSFPNLNLEEEEGSAAVCSDRAVSSSERKSTMTDSRSKILVRIRPKSKNDAAELDYNEAATATVATDGADAAVAAVDADGSLRDHISGGSQEAEELAPKSWNLRPRKPPTKKRSKGNGGGVLKNCVNSMQENEEAQGTGRPESTRSRNSADANIAAESKGKKHKFSISLTKMEIDEDFFALTGSKSSRRPRKRTRNVQKQLDVLFPGLWMSLISPDAYKVSHSSKV